MQGCKQSRRVRPRHLAGSLLQEATRPRPLREWLQSAVDTLGLIPGLNVPAEVLSGGFSLCEGDLVGFGLSLAGLLPVAGECAVALKIARRARRLAQGVRFGARVGYRARMLAQEVRTDRRHPPARRAPSRSPHRAAGPLPPPKPAAGASRSRSWPSSRPDGARPRRPHGRPRSRP